MCPLVYTWCGLQACNNNNNLASMAELHMFISNCVMLRAMIINVLSYRSQYVVEIDNVECQVNFFKNKHAYLVTFCPTIPLFLF